MEITPLTLLDCDQWAELLAISFHRPSSDMRTLLHWLHKSRELVAWGAWEGTQLVAQYACLISRLFVPEMHTTVEVGMSLNMAVHPDFRGKGLIKQVAKPVYDCLHIRGTLAGVGFSNAEGVKVDQRSKSYGYNVVGRMVSSLAWIPPQRQPSPLELTEEFPSDFYCADLRDKRFAHFSHANDTLFHRYAGHPFRRYHFGVWREGSQICGVVVYRHVTLAGIPAIALLAAYGGDLPELLKRWCNTLQKRGHSLVHLLTTSHSPLREALAGSTVCVQLPYNRSPYYLTLKPLKEHFPKSLFEFKHWDCMGGDIL